VNAAGVQSGQGLGIAPNEQSKIGSELRHLLWLVDRGCPAIDGSRMALRLVSLVKAILHAALGSGIGHGEPSLVAAHRATEALGPAKMPLSAPPPRDRRFGSPLKLSRVQSLMQPLAT
jgi:hypothetical protein